LLSLARIDVSLHLVVSIYCAVDNSTNKDEYNNYCDVNVKIILKNLTVYKTM